LVWPHSRLAVLISASLLICANLAKGSLANRCCFHCKKMRLLELRLRRHLSRLLCLRSRHEPAPQTASNQLR
jgi:hypothetical protein